MGELLLVPLMLLLLRRRRRRQLLWAPWQSNVCACACMETAVALPRRSQQLTTTLFHLGDKQPIQALVQRVMSYNEPPIPPERVRGFKTRNESDAWMVSNGDGTLGAVHFARDARGNVEYMLQSNSTVKYFKGSFQDPTTFFQMPFMNAVAREAARAAVLRKAAAGAPLAPSPAFKWAPRLVAFPHPFLQSTSVLGGVLAAFLFAALMFGFVSQMAALVGEREAGLRTALRNMGMRESAYWASWVAYDAAMALLGALLIVVFGLVLQFDYFKRNDFALPLVLFWLFGMAMSSYAYALSVFLKRSQVCCVVCLGGLCLCCVAVCFGEGERAAGGCACL